MATFVNNKSTVQRHKLALSINNSTALGGFIVKRLYCIKQLHTAIKYMRDIARYGKSLVEISLYGCKNNS